LLVCAVGWVGGAELSETERAAVALLNLTARDWPPKPTPVGVIVIIMIKPVARCRLSILPRQATDSSG
jgi:hypothetical protein